MSIFVPSNYDSRTSLIFCYQLKKSALEAHRMLVEAYGQHALGNIPKKFEDAELQALLDEDDGQTQQQLAEQLNVTQ